MVCSLPALQLAAHARASNAVHNLPCQLDVDDLMSPGDLKMIFAGLKDDKGHGPDSIPAELFKNAPMAVLMHVHALMLKCLARIEEPVRWKGTCLSQLYKGAGDASACGNYRGNLHQ